MRRRPFLDQWPGQFPHIEGGVQHAADAFGHHHGFLQEQELRLRFHLEFSGDLEHLAEQLRHRNFIERLAGDRPRHGHAGLREGFQRFSGGHIPGGEMHLRHMAVILGHEAAQDFGDIEPRFPVQPPHDAEIDGH